MDFLKKIYNKLFLFKKVYLTKYWRCHRAQFGEDVVLSSWIDKKINKGFYVDVGCYHPWKYSNTYFLYKRGWRGVNIDLDDIKIEAMNLARPQDTNIVAAVSDETSEVEVYANPRKYCGITTIETSHVQPTQCSRRTITTETLNQILANTSYKDREIDLLSIDVEGHDFNVLKALDFDKYKPKVILIETLIKNFEHIYDSELFKLLIKKGYNFANWVGYTLFFVHPQNNLMKQ